MGCWNETCGISQLHITAGQKVAIFMIEQNGYNEHDEFHYTNGFYNPCLLPFYGEYDDYGGAEDLSGFGLNIVVDAVRNQLVEQDIGENKCHDIAVSRSDFDSEKMFEAMHECRLLSKDYDGSPLQLKRVMIHNDVFNEIICNWTQQYHYYDKAGEFKTANYSFYDVANSIHSWIERAKIKCQSNIKLAYSYSLDSLFDRTEYNFFARTVHFYRGESNRTSLIDAGEIVSQYIKDGNDHDLLHFLTELAKGYWINQFMHSTRKMWGPQSGLGSQAQEHNGYRVLINAMSKVLAQEEAERQEWEDNDD